MRIVVFGATGDVGQLVVVEAAGRGHAVTAIARDRSRLDALPKGVRTLDIDIAEEPASAMQAMQGQDAVISALRPPSGQEGALVTLTQTVVSAAQAFDLPVYVTGGAARLKIPDGSGDTVLTARNFLPAAVRPIAEACALQEDALLANRRARWTCLRPPAVLIHGPRTGHYQFGMDTLVTDADGRSHMSYADFALAMVDLAEASSSPHRLLTIGCSR